MNEPIICSELENAYDVNLFTGSLSHCCKFEYIQPNKEEIDLLGYKYLDFNKETVKARQELAQGIQTSRCKDCWSYENNNQQSWRIKQNKVQRVDKFINLNLQISSLCNQSCFYCLPSLSSSIKKLNLWPDTTSGELIIYPEENQSKITLEHITDFVKNIPITTKRFDLSLTGGEPFIVDNFNESMKHIIEVFFAKDSNRTVVLCISTNTNVKLEKLESFYSMIRELKLKHNNRFTVRITSSLENLEERAEYVRGGLVWSNFLENFKIHNDNADHHEIRLTINPFTISKITDFFKYFSCYKNLEFLYNYPYQKFWRIEVLDDRFKKELVNLEEYIISNNLVNRFNPYPWYTELEKFIIDDKKNAQIFKQAISGIDVVRKTNWRNVFPEYIDWVDSITGQ